MREDATGSALIVAAHQGLVEQSLDALSMRFPWMCELGATPQEPEWHGEGDVERHTLMVMKEAQDLGSSLKRSEADLLMLAAALHDVGKAKQTREAEIAGIRRIVSPRHALAGASHVALHLAGSPLSLDDRKRLVALIAHHHDPGKISAAGFPRQAIMRFARSVDPRLLIHLEAADIRGRITAGKQQKLEELELLSLEMAELEVSGETPAYQDWSEEIRQRLPDASSLDHDYVLHRAQRWFEEGLIYTVDEAIAKTHQRRQSGFPQLIITCGTSGSGKSTHVEALENQGWSVVSPDRIRNQIARGRDDQSRNGQVFQQALENLREQLRKQGTCRVIWDATLLRGKDRQRIISLGHDYGAHVSIHAILQHPERARQQNAKRKDPVPRSVLDRQVNAFEIPLTEEADCVEWLWQDLPLDACSQG